MQKTPLAIPSQTSSSLSAGLGQQVSNSQKEKDKVLGNKVAFYYNCEIGGYSSRDVCEFSPSLQNKFVDKYPFWDTFSTRVIETKAFHKIEIEIESVELFEFNKPQEVELPPELAGRLRVSLEEQKKQSEKEKSLSERLFQVRILIKTEYTDQVIRQTLNVSQKGPKDLMVHLYQIAKGQKDPSSLEIKVVNVYDQNNPPEAKVEVFKEKALDF